MIHNINISIVDHKIYIVGVSITELYCGQRFISCGYILWMYRLWITYVVGVEYMLWIYIVGVNCSIHILWITYVVDDMNRCVPTIYKSVTHNIYILWVYVVEYFEFYRCQVNIDRVCMDQVQLHPYQVCMYQVCMFQVHDYQIYIDQVCMN